MVQPIQWIHLDAIHPDLPVQVRAGYAPRAAHQANHLACFHYIADVHRKLRLVPQATIYTPAMIDDRRVASHRQWGGKYYLAWRGGKDLQTLAAAKIETRMKSIHFKI